MPPNSLRLLFVDDSSSDTELLLRHIRRQIAVDSKRIDSAAEFMREIESEWDAILCDYSMPSFDAPGALQILKKAELDIPFLLVSGSIGEERAVEIMRMGAKDIILKDQLARLYPALLREIADAKDRTHRREAE